MELSKRETMNKGNKTEIRNERGARELQEQLQKLHNTFREERRQKEQEDAVYAELLLGKALGNPYLETAETVMRKYSIDRSALDKAVLRASNRHLERLQQGKGE
jgi:acetyl-CoA acetyltransferase